METPELNIAAGCSPQRGTLKEEKHSDSETVQRDNFPGTKDKIPLKERPHRDDLRSCPSTETQAVGSGTIPPLQPSDQNPFYTWRKTQRFPPPGKRCFQSSVNLLSVGVHKKELKVKKTGKYVCHYCGRACAKPSVLKKHIRSHTGERPYPCVPCGFSFKTKSNLYKHRKSHTHAVKAGLFPFSDQDRKLGSMDEEVTVGEGEMHSDAEQSTDTDEEVKEESALAQRQPLHTGSSIQIKDRGQEKCGGHTQKIPGITFTQSSSNESMSGKVSLLQFREMMTPVIVTQVDQELESSTIKQRLALRLSEKRSQDSLSLPSSYSKGSTDSGYFSRSESAEQQCSQPSANAKSYQEIMFGKCYRPSAKPRQSITVQTCMADINETPSSFMIKLTKGMAPEEATCHLHRHKKNMARSIKIESESFQEEEYPEIPELFQCRTELLETPPECGLLLRSNSLPTPSDSNISAQQALRSSNSFDERMTNEEISFRSSIGMRKLMRQAAFEHSAHEGHAEPDNHTLICGLKSEPKVDSADDSKTGIENCPESESCLMFQNHMMENATRKRRKGKNIMEEEYFPTQNKPLCLPDLTGDLCTKQDILDTTYSETERWTGSNVISVIQHTKSLSRPSSTEKSTDFESQQFNISQLAEKEQSKERYKTDPLMHSGKIEAHYSGSSLIYQWSHLSKQLAFQSGIQVPEIRVTEEPEKTEKVRDQVRPNEKNREEFQWPQRSETLSNFPVEKLPPKKKRLRLAEMECSSGESSFESACTSLSRSPSQDSNLSHSSSFSQSLDKEEGMNVASPAKSDEFSKCLEFLSVPGSLLSQQREMRRSASEQASCNLPAELPECRSKSFDYSNLSFSTSCSQSDIYSTECGFKERKRGCLVRQASLSGDLETLTHDKSMEMNATQESSDAVEMSKKMSSSDKQFLMEGSSSGVEKMRYSLLPGNVSPQQLISPELSRMPEQILPKQPLLPQTLQMHQWHGLKQKIKKEPKDSQTAEDPRIPLADLPKDHSQSVANVLSTIAVLSQAQPALANQSLHGLLVPVRIQMQVPCYGNITYTSISHILDSQYATNLTPNNVLTQSQCFNVTSQHRVGLDVCQTPGHPRGLLHNPSSSPAKLNTGIPLSLTSRTISTTEAPSSGASKRMLSPASSIELFIEATQQKRVKDENMYGQIVEELSAVEIGHPDLVKEKRKKENKSTNRQNSSGTVEEIEMDDPNTDFYNKADLPLPGIVSSETILINKLPISVQIATTTLPRDIANTWTLSQFPGLHTTTCVSWCYLNCSKPNSTQTVPNFSVYAAWFMRCHNPNPPSLSTGKALALLQSKQRKQNTTYTIAAMYQPGILVTSTLSSYKQEQGTIKARVGDITYDTQMKDIKQKGRPSHDNSKETEAPLRQTEPARVKIFEGGYKSNEDYVYVRGRGRGKYICEECGIRCKKPSMLKKHIRTHTDVRPYICKCCNFAFKTKGNLTKHMKSKAHLKKCLELGVSPMNMDNTDIAEHEDDAQKSSEARPVIDAAIKHQFSDVDDSDGGEEDGDEPDDEDEEYDGDSTPRTHSRSTSPQPYTINKPFPSICFTKKLDSKESLEASLVNNEDDLTIEQRSTTFDPCTAQLLSPCWDSPHQKNICLRGDVSPQGHLASGRASSPLRPIFSRQDVNIRGDLSPIRQLSPVRPISPATDVSRYRTSSPRGQHRGMLRAASPRRGAYQHRSYVESSREMICESSALRQTIAIYPEMDKREAALQNVTDGIRCGTDASTVPSQGIFSHLPLHSQQQVQTPIPMVPIGGLRMPSVCPSGVTVERHSQSLPQGNLLERANSRQASVCIPGPGVSNISSQRKEQPTSCTGLASEDKKQEENVHICAEAIASLRITSEDIIGNPSKS